MIFKNIAKKMQFIRPEKGDQQAHIAHGDHVGWCSHKKVRHLGMQERDNLC